MNNEEQILKYLKGIDHKLSQLLTHNDQQRIGVARRKSVALAQATWNDIITESEVIEKLKISKAGLRRMRQHGKIKHFRYLNPSTTGNPTRPGKNAVYSLKELNSLFSATL